MIKKALRQFLEDIKYPFGKPDESRFEMLIPTEHERIAIKNMLALARERIWIGRGRDKSGVKIDKFKDLMSHVDADLADKCLSYTELYLKRTASYAKEKEDHS